MAASNVSLQTVRSMGDGHTRETSQLTRKEPEERIGDDGRVFQTAPDIDSRRPATDSESRSRESKELYYGVGEDFQTTQASRGAKYNPIT